MLVELDSASLYAHHDSSSFFSKCSDNLSKFSTQFNFDRELFVTKVYEKVFRSSVKDSLVQQHSLVQERNDTVSTKKSTLAMWREQTRLDRRSQAIDRKLEEDFRKHKREAKILLLGNPGSIKEDIFQQMITKDLRVSTEERLREYRYPVRQSVIQCAKALVAIIRTIDIRPGSDVNNSHYDFLQEYTVDLDPDVPLRDIVGEAIDALWKDPFTAEVLKSSDEFYLKDSAP